MPELLKRNVLPDVVTDQTSAHDELNGYVPHGIPFEKALELRKRDPQEYIRRSVQSMVVHTQAMVEFQKRGAIVFDYGNNLRGQAFKAGFADAFAYPGFVPAYIRPLFCQGKGPFRWAALSGDPRDIHTIDDEVLRIFPHDEGLARWIKTATPKIPFQGLPARICWLGQGDRAKFGLAINDLVRSGKVSRSDRDRPRSSRLRLGGLALSRNGSDEGRLRRDCRLADSQRAGQHGLRRVVGEFPSRRRRGDRSLASCRSGDRGRRNAMLPRRDSSACSPTIRRWACSAITTRATRKQRDTARRHNVRVPGLNY